MQAQGNTRIQALRSYLAERKQDAALFTQYENRRYFSGFTGSAGYLIVTDQTVTLVTDKRYTTQAQQQTCGVHIVECGAGRQRLVADTIAKLHINTLVMESDTVCGEYFAIKENLPDVTVTFEQEYFLEMRMVKEPGEIAAIRAAIACAEAGFTKTLACCKIGMTERDLANELHYRVSKEGAEAMSFGTIVASGPRGALPHGIPTDKVIEDGDMVVVDFGAMKDGYCSDITRTLLFGDVPKDQKAIFDLVSESFQLAIDAVRPGALAREVEDAHRVPFLREGVNDYALKGLGHGVGLQIHECPRIVIGNTTVLKPGMVFTIEPGLYYPDAYGVRTENDVLVTETGVQDLCTLPIEMHIHA